MTSDKLGAGRMPMLQKSLSLVCLAWAVLSVNFAHRATGTSVVEDTCALLEDPLWNGRTEGYRITAPRNSISGSLLPVQVERRGKGVEDLEECRLCYAVGSEALHQTCTLVQLYRGKGSAALRLNSLSTQEPSLQRLNLTSTVTGDDGKSPGILLATTTTVLLPREDGDDICDEVYSGYLVIHESLSWQHHSIICVLSTITIPAGKILQVSGGTTVLIAKGADVIVHGILQVIGEVDSPVIWVPMDLGPWGGIELRSGAQQDTSRNIFLHSWFVGGGGSLHKIKIKGKSQLQPVVLIETSDLTMVGGGIMDSPGMAFYASKSSVFASCIQVWRCDTIGGNEGSRLYLEEGDIMTEVLDRKSLSSDDDCDASFGPSEAACDRNGDSVGELRVSDVNNNGVALYECNHRCSALQYCFLSRCWCLPGFSGKACSLRNVYPKLEAARCPTYLSANEVRDKLTVDFHGNCEVSRWTNNPTACGIFCNWADDAGITMVSNSSWKHVAQNELEHHERYYKGHSPEQLKEGQTRWRENSNGFQNFRALPHGSLGDYLEVGAGMYTQLWNLLKLRPDAQPSSITLLEPNINRYLELGGCTFSDGKLNGQNVTLINDVLENFNRVDSFETVLVVNVVEHVIDSSRFLSAVHRALRPGGLLIWGERYFEDPDEESTRVLGSTLLHPIRLTPEYIDHFLSHFDPIYSASFDTPQSRERNFGEQGYFYMGRKHAHAA